MRRANLALACAIAAAAFAIGAVLGQPGSGRAAAGGPVNMGTPTISGAAQEGQPLSVSTGTWSGSPTSYAYVWSQCDASGSSCSPISGATASTYKPASADVGHAVRVTVTATNTGGSARATSAPSAVVSSATAPTNTVAPSISGSLTVGSTLTASQGTWSAAPTNYTFAWIRCGPSGNSCARIDGATQNTYTLSQADAATTLRVAVTATNTTGSTQYTSAQTAALPRSNGCPAGTGTIQIAELVPPARLSIDRATITPRLVSLSTHRIQLHFLITACNGRPVQGASVYATPIPFNQFTGPDETTDANGAVTITETRLHGFPARNRHQELLAVFVRASKPGDPLLGGVSTRRAVAFPVNLP